MAPSSAADLARAGALTVAETPGAMRRFVVSVRLPYAVTGDEVADAFVDLVRVHPTLTDRWTGLDSQAPECSPLPRSVVDRALADVRRRLARCVTEAEPVFHDPSVVLPLDVVRRGPTELLVSGDHAHMNGYGLAAWVDLLLGSIARGRGRFTSGDLARLTTRYGRTASRHVTRRLHHTRTSRIQALRTFEAWTAERVARRSSLPISPMVRPFGRVRTGRQTLRTFRLPPVHTRKVLAEAAARKLPLSMWVLQQLARQAVSRQSDFGVYLTSDLHRLCPGRSALSPGNLTGSLPVHFLAEDSVSETIAVAMQALADEVPYTALAEYAAGVSDWTTARAAVIASKTGSPWAPGADPAGRMHLCLASMGHVHHPWLGEVDELAAFYGSQNYPLMTVYVHRDRLVLNLSVPDDFCAAAPLHALVAATLPTLASPEA